MINVLPGYITEIENHVLHCLLVPRAPVNKILSLTIPLSPRNTWDSFLYPNVVRFHSDMFKCAPNFTQCIWHLVNLSMKKLKSIRCRQSKSLTDNFLPAIFCVHHFYSNLVRFSLCSIPLLL